MGLDRSCRCILFVDVASSGLESEKFQFSGLKLDMRNLSNFLIRISNWKTLAIFLIIYILFNSVLLKSAEARINELADKPIGVIDLTFGFDPQKSMDMVADYGEAARAYYARIEMTLDVVYPAVYAFLFGIILTLIYREKSYAWVNGLPFAAMLFDYMENVNILVLLNAFPEQPMIFAQMCEIFKLLKWISLGITVLLAISGLFLKLKKPASSG